MTTAAALVVLAAGAGQRFVDAGWTVPKPLIRFRGHTLMAHTLRMILRGAGGILGPRIVVTTPACVDHVPRDFTTVVVEHTRPGPTASAALALGLISPETPVVFFDCDNIYTTDPADLFSKFLLGSNFLVGARLATPSTDYCAIRAAHNGFVIDLQEKSDKFNLVATGIYGFRTAQVFHECYCRAATRDLYAMSDLLMDESEVASVVALPTGSWYAAGTPTQLAAAELGVPK